MAERLSSAPPGSNLTPDTFVEGFLELMRLKRAVDEATGKYRAARKRLEGQGADLKALALVEGWRKLDADEVEQRLRKSLQYAAWLSMPIGSQPSLFADLPHDKPGEKMRAEQARWAAEEAGYMSGKAGGDRNEDNPYPPGTENHVAWDEGWVRGQAAIAEGMRPSRKPKQARGERRPSRRGRSALN